MGGDDLCLGRKVSCLKTVLIFYVLDFTIIPFSSFPFLPPNFLIYPFSFFQIHGFFFKINYCFVVAYVSVPKYINKTCSICVILLVCVF